MARARAPRLLLFALAVLATSCARCGKKVGTSAELTSLLTKDCEAALVVPDLGSLGGKLRILERLKVASFTAQLQGFADASQYASALMGQLGVDLRSKGELAKVGIDPRRGVAVVFLKGNLAYSVVAVGDEKKFAQFIERIAAQRLGAAHVSRRQEQGLSLTELSAGAGAPVRLAYAFREGHAFVAADQSAAQLRGWAGLTPAASLASDSTLTGALGRLPAPRDAFVLVPPASSYVGGGKVAGAALALSLSERALDLRLDVPFPGMTDTLRILEPKPAAELLGHLPSDAFLAGRFAGDATLLAGFTRSLLGPHLSGAFDEAGFDVKAEVLDNLRPGGSFALSLAPEVDLGGGMPALDVRQTNPFRYVHLTAIAQTKSGEKAAATLEKLAPIGPRFGARIEAKERGGRRVFLTHYAQGEGVHFAAVGDKVVVAAPLGRLDPLLVTAAGQPSPGGGALPDRRLRQALSGKGVAAVVDLRRLAESVRALPPEAWGVGGFAIRSSSLRWLDATNDLTAITLSLSAKESAAQAHATLHFEPAPAEGQAK